MKRNQFIELIVQYHYLFAHLLTNQWTKRTAKGKQPTVKKQPSAQLINQLINPVYNPPTLKQLASLARPNKLTQPGAHYQNIPQLTYNPDQNIPQVTQQHINNINNIDPKALEGIPRFFFIFARLSKYLARSRLSFSSKYSSRCRSNSSILSK